MLELVKEIQREVQDVLEVISPVDPSGRKIFFPTPKEEDWSILPTNPKVAGKIQRQLNISVFSGSYHLADKIQDIRLKELAQKFVNVSAPNKRYHLEVPIYSGEYVELTARKVEKGEMVVTISLSLPASSPYANIFQEYFSQANIYSLSKIIGRVLIGFVKSKFKRFPSIYSPDFVPTPFVADFISKLQDGQIIYLPSIPEHNYEIFKSAVSKGILVGNALVSISDNTKQIIYVDNEKAQQVFSIRGYKPLSENDLTGWLNRPAESLYSAYGTSDLGALYDWARYYPNLYQKFTRLKKMSRKGTLDKEVASKLNVSVGRVKGSNSLSVGDLIVTQPEMFESFLLELETEINEHNSIQSMNNSFSPITYLKVKAILEILKICLHDAVGIKSRVTREILEFENTTVNDLPEIPNINKDIVFFPHQAESIAKLDKCPEHAIVDISTGGMKTGIIISDILNYINKGVITKPLVIMPLALVGQWINEIEFFTGGSVNVVPITTETVSNWGREAVERIVRESPINTIFITTYSFISNGKYYLPDDEDETTPYFKGADWIQEILHPDYIALDEVQKVKNPETNASRAVNFLGEAAKVKRIATGTLITNNPIDLVGQIGFLDSSIMGSKAEFNARYMRYINISDFANVIRRDLKNNSRYIMYRRKDWASLLPKIQYSENFINLTTKQKALYKKMVLEVMDEISKDPVLKRAWDKFRSSDKEDYDIPAILLGKLARLEQYLTAPDVHNLVKELGELEAVSPKIKEIDKLIEQSIKDGYKVIVSTHYHVSAKHLYENSRFKNVGRYYDAKHKDVIIDFQKNPDVKVLFSISISLKEGFNLQQANRIIIADVDWTPGALEQLEARIFRPHLKYENGNLVSLNDSKTVHINTVLANHSADIFKYIFQNFKKLRNARIMENSPVALIDSPEFSDEALIAPMGSKLLGGKKAIEGIRKFQEWTLSEIERIKKRGKLKFIPVRHAPSLGNQKINSMWVEGMNLPCADNEYVLSDYAERFVEFLAENDLHAISDRIIGRVAKTEFGYGIIHKITSSLNVSVKLFEPAPNGKKTVSASYKTVVIAPDASSKNLFAESYKKTEKEVNSKKVQVLATDIPIIKRSTINQVANKYGLEIIRREANGEFIYKWRLTGTNKVITIPNHLSKLSDMSWEQWMTSLNTAVKRFGI